MIHQINTVDHISSDYLSCVLFFHFYATFVCVLLIYISCVCLDKERERARERYVKATLRLHELHNEYVLSVRAAQVYHQHHYSQAQPALLMALQRLQQEMVLVL